MRKIIHVDMDCFYAQVATKDNPSLKGKPIGVGGRSGRGVLTTASYEARKFGVRSAMPTQRALKLCPDLILVPTNFSRYKEESRHIREIFSRYTDKIEPLSLDEAYLDVSHSENATLIAKEIRKTIFEETQLTASAGIAPNKFLAKVASDWKKPNGQFTVHPNKVSEFVKTLKVEKIPGVGKVTAKKMHSKKILTCLDLQKYSIEELKLLFGVWGIRLFDICRGKDERQVSSGGERKSLSVESTYGRDLKDLKECLEMLPKLFDEFNRRLIKSNTESRIQSHVVKVKFYDFKQTTLEKASTRIPSIDDFSNMLEEAFARGKRPVRLLGLGVKLKSKKKKQKTLQLEWDV